LVRRTRINQLESILFAGVLRCLKTFLFPMGFTFLWASPTMLILMRRTLWISFCRLKSWTN
ncbi:hypothetical protein BGX34_005604, partial [Mortierella sp. NVP85]